MLKVFTIVLYGYCIVMYILLSIVKKKKILGSVLAPLRYEVIYIEREKHWSYYRTLGDAN